MSQVKCNMNEKHVKRNSPTNSGRLNHFHLDKLAIVDKLGKTESDRQIVRLPSERIPIDFVQARSDFQALNSTLNVVFNFKRHSLPF